ncbi:MAG: multidrug efflux SMR transporter [Selenomonadaceae bacterium]|nr:multidrug efflux SMR transporter [Selenomonadaceae bacterium]
MNSWIILFIAGLFEVSWAIGLKYTQGFSRLLPSILTIIGMTLSFVFLSLALKKLPLSIAYAVWTGIGIAGTSILGVLIFNEAVSATKIIFVSLIVIGIAGLRLTN